MNEPTKKKLEDANAASIKAIKAAYLKVARNRRGGPWIGCD